MRPCIRTGTASRKIEQRDELGSLPEGIFSLPAPPGVEVTHFWVTACCSMEILASNDDPQKASHGHWSHTLCLHALVSATLRPFLLLLWFPPAPPTEHRITSPAPSISFPFRVLCLVWLAKSRNVTSRRGQTTETVKQKNRKAAKRSGDAGRASNQDSKPARASNFIATALSLPQISGSGLHHKGSWASSCQENDPLTAPFSPFPPHQTQQFFCCFLDNNVSNPPTKASCYPLNPKMRQPQLTAGMPTNTIRTAQASKAVGRHRERNRARAPRPTSPQFALANLFHPYSSSLVGRRDRDAVGLSVDLVRAGRGVVREHIRRPAVQPLVCGSLCGSL